MNPSVMTPRAVSWLIGAATVASLAWPGMASATIFTLAQCSPPGLGSPFDDRGNKPLSSAACPFVSSNVGSASSSASAFASYGALGGTAVSSQTLLGRATTTIIASYDDSAVVALSGLQRVFAVVSDPVLLFEGNVSVLGGDPRSSWGITSTFTAYGFTSGVRTDFSWRRGVGEGYGRDGLQVTDILTIQGTRRFEIANGSIMGFTGFVTASTVATNGHVSSASVQLGSASRDAVQLSGLADVVEDEAGLTDLSALLNDTPYGAFWNGLRFEDEFGNPVSSSMVQLVSRSGTDWSRSFVPTVVAGVPLPTTALLATLALFLLPLRRGAASTSGASGAPGSLET